MSNFTATVTTAIKPTLFALLLGLTACNGSQTTNEEKTQDKATELESSQASTNTNVDTNSTNTTNATNVEATQYQRIAVLSPDVTNIVLSLGAKDKIVGKDAMNHDPALQDVPAVGTHRNITPEAITSVNPDLVLGSYMVQPQTVYKRLNELGIKAVNVAPKEGIDTFANGIVTIGELIGKPSEAQQLSNDWLDGMQERNNTGLRYLMSYDGRIVAGKDTVADDLIKRAGGINAADNITGLKPLTREGWLEANPDVIIIADHNKATVGDVTKFSQRPEIMDSPAVKNQQVEFWPVQDFLVFGLHSPEVVERLNQFSRK